MSASTMEAAAAENRREFLARHPAELDRAIAAFHTGDYLSKDDREGARVWCRAILALWQPRKGGKKS